MKFRSKSTPWVLGALVLLAIGSARLIQLRTGLGGLSPTYNAKDFDGRLSREVAKASSTIKALAEFHRKNGLFPAGVQALPEPIGWTYVRNPDGAGYTLSCKLGWDPSLIYAFDGTQGRWIFDPGDGSPQRTILLPL